MKNHYYSNILLWRSSFSHFLAGILVVVVFIYFGILTNRMLIPAFDELALIHLILPFITGLVGLGFAMKFIHHAGFQTLIFNVNDQKISFSKIGYGFALWFTIQVVIELFMYFVNPSNYVFNNHPDFKWIILLLVAVIFIPFQTTFEELFIRSYLLQHFFKLFGNPLISLLISSLIFTLLHFNNPEATEYGLAKMVAYYFLAGLFIGLISYFDNRLELSIGMHAANNIYAAAFVGYNNSAFGTKPLIMIKELNFSESVTLFLAGSTIFLIICRYKYNWVFRKFNFDANDERLN